MAEPSRRNSGLEQTAKSASGRSAVRRRSISRLVPTGTVDLVAITVKSLRWGASSSTAWNTKLKSAWPSPRRIGVPTARNTVCVPDRRREIRRKCDAPHAQVTVQELVEARLVDRHAALTKVLDLARVLIDASHRPAEFRKASGGDQAHIACPNHRNVHETRL